MVVCIVILLVTVLCGWYFRKRGTPIPQKALRLMLFLQCLGLAFCLTDKVAHGNFSGKVARNEVGEGSITGEWRVSGGGFTEEIQLEIPERTLSEEEAKQLFAAAEQEIDETILGDNKDLDHVTQNLNLQDSYQDGLVEAAWSFDDTQIVSVDGVLQIQNLEEETLIQATVVLYCQEYESRYTFPFRVCLPKNGTQERFSYDVKNALREAEESTALQETFLFPKKAEEMKLSWTPKENNRGIQIAFLGIIAGVGVVVGEKEDRRRREKKEELEKRRDYPEIISSLSLFLGVGLSVQAAFGRIGEQYLLRRENASQGKRAGLEEILMTYREMQDGTGELEALRHLGERNSLREYRKLALLLQQNLKKGTKELLTILEREEEIAYELRQNLAKQAGEEASTKLLLPMMGFLVMVMILLLVPAMLNIRI